MDFDGHIQRIEDAIKELSDIKAHLVQARTDFTVDKCAPFFGIVSPSPSRCTPNPIDVTVDGIEPAVIGWVQDTVNRLVNPLGESQ